MERLNALWETVPPPATDGLRGRHQRAVWSAVAPAFARQQEWNSAVVRILNGQVEEGARAFAAQKQLASALVQYLQRVQPLMDARDRVASAPRRHARGAGAGGVRPPPGVAGAPAGGAAGAARPRGGGLREVRAVEGTLRRGGPAAGGGGRRRARRGRRGLRRVREPLPRQPRRDPRAPCVLRRALSRRWRPWRTSAAAAASSWSCCARRVSTASGVETQRAGRGASAGGAGSTVEDGLAARFPARHAAAASLGGVFAAQVAEHLPPAVLQAALAEAHRALRPGGLLVLETVNPRSVLGFLEVYHRDLTHEKPLHPDTLSFLAAAAGLHGRARRDALARRRRPRGSRRCRAEGLPPRAARGAQRERGAPERAALRPAGVRAASRGGERARRLLLAAAARAHRHRRLRGRRAGAARAGRYEIDGVPRPGRGRRRRACRRAASAPARVARGAAPRAAVRHRRLPDGQRRRARRSCTTCCRALPGLLVLHDLVLHHARARMFLDAPEARAYAAAPHDARAPRRGARSRSTRYAAEVRVRVSGAGRAPARGQLGTVGDLLPYAYPLFRLPVEASRAVAVHNAFMADAVRAEVPDADVSEVPMPIAVTASRPSACARCARGSGSRRTTFVVGSVRPDDAREADRHRRARGGARGVPRCRRCALLLVGPVPDRARARRGDSTRAACRDARSWPAASRSPSWPRTSRRRTWSRTCAIRPRARRRPRCCACSPRAGRRSCPTSRTWRTCRTAPCVRADVADEEGEVTRAILRLAESPALRARLGAAARAHVASAHSPARCRETYSAAIEKTARG